MSADNAVFYLENPDKVESIDLHFTLELNNFTFPGAPDQNSFKVLLGPGKTYH